MIPKKIHYVWIGGKEMPQLAQKCIESRKKYLPDYELCLWNESNFDINSNKYVKQAYEAKKFAFVWDYIRIWAMYNYGGISMDTDVEVLKNLDKFLDLKGFSGFESKDIIPTGIMASEKGNPFIGEILNWYQDKEFNPNHLVPNTVIITDIAKEKYGFIGGDGDKLVKLKGNIYAFYPKSYFCPINCLDLKVDYKKYLNDKNCYTIHWFAGSRTEDKIRTMFKKVLLYILKKIHLYNFVKMLYHKYVK